MPSSQSGRTGLPVQLLIPLQASRSDIGFSISNGRIIVKLGKSQFLYFGQRPHDFKNPVITPCDQAIA